MALIKTLKEEKQKAATKFHTSMTKKTLLGDQAI
jgi:hypothetical protein